MTNANRPRLVLAGTSSGAGKTTLAVGLMAALRRRGCTVQGFKVGPDYIDPSYHTAVTGRVSRNLDTWMMKPEAMREVFWRGSEGADISVIEGVMGFYDGKDPLSNQGSTAEISVLLEAPVLLVVDVKAMARSAAAIVKGFQLLDPAVRIAGVIANRVGSVSHFQMVKAAVEQMCDVPVIGYVQHEESLRVPERHLGLIPALERGELAPWFERLAERVEAGIDLEQVIGLASQAAPLTPPAPALFAPADIPADEPPVTIAVARDAAFHFYYPENLELLAHYGARLVAFSPLAGELPPADADGLYIGGGFPEEFAPLLAANAALRAELKRRIEAGLPTFAECGGYMFLCEAITDRAGVRHEMAGVIPREVRMQDRLAALGYREAVALTDTLLMPKGATARGHEFHYSVLVEEPAAEACAYELTGLRGTKPEGYARDNLLAGYTHLHFASRPDMVPRWLNACRKYRQQRGERR